MQARVSKTEKVCVPLNGTSSGVAGSSSQVMSPGLSLDSLPLGPVSLGLNHFLTVESWPATPHVGMFPSSHPPWKECISFLVMPTRVLGLNLFELLLNCMLNALTVAKGLNTP